MAKAAINRKKAAKEFAEKWLGRGDEKQDTQAFWTSLLRDVFGVANPEDSIQFEKRIKLGHTSFIDAYIPSTKVLIEQKSVDVDLLKPAKQSDGNMLTPYQQADRYRKEQNYSEVARWIVTCNFKEFFIYDMDHREAEPEHIFLKDLDKDFTRLQFLIDQRNADISREEKISLKAGELVGKLYDALIKEYIPPTSLNRHSERSEESERSFAYAQDDKLSDLQFRSLNILCVRIVFCLYAEDVGLFETRTAFEDYIKSFNLSDLRDGIIKLFKALDTKPENRNKYDTKINSFPYVNGGLFADDAIEIPNFTKEIVDVIVNHCAPFDWSEISPTIFGAVFESTLNPETRRKGGMHYTSIENIHKVIDPLFLDDLKAEFASIVGTRHPEHFPVILSEAKNLRDVSHSFNMTAKTKNRLEQFRNKLASLTFLDPACGSGNFLTETYISLRRLENECLKIIHGSQMLLSSDDFSPIKVKISQFYGIEINDFAVTVAKTALWIAESQMMKETEEIVEENLDFLPLSTSATIVEGNALRMDWRYLHEEAEIPTIKAKKTNLIYPFMVRESGSEYCASDTFSDKEHGFEYDEINLITNEINVGKPQRKQEANHYDYIMGNPPFVGKKEQSKTQKNDIVSLFTKTVKGVGNLDYVTGWYAKAIELIRGKKTKCAFVSTNSITQGEQVPTLWRYLSKQGLSINFAWRTFRWDSESTQKAQVHCVIVGFSHKDSPMEKIRVFDESGIENAVSHINGYLIDAADVFIENRAKPLCDVPKIVYGSMPIDNNHLILTKKEADAVLAENPANAKFVRKYAGGEELLNGEERFCLWLTNVSVKELKQSKIISRRVGETKDFRSKSSRPQTLKLADTPWLFGEIRQPENQMLVIPKVSSERRRYIPIAFVSPEIIVNGSALIVPDATLYEFGVLMSNVHNAWMRVVAGRMKSDYQYSGTVVYNNFPWPDLSDCCAATSPDRRGKEYRYKIEQTAQAILDARAKHAGDTLADLYDETFMPADLRKAHQENDKAVLAAYGFNLKMSESEIVAKLFKMYEKLTAKSSVSAR